MNREKHRLYSTWKSMRSRCSNPNVSCYHNYGGRGIKVCERWNDFLLFLEDMESSFKEGLTLDRKDNNLGYFPDNCRWATTKEQANNMSTNLSLLYRGSFYTEAKLAEYTNVSRTTIQQRRNKGYSVEEMVHGREGTGKFKIEYKEQIYSGKELAELVGVKVGTLRYRVRQGWSINEIVNRR
jgi:hypothetical protein